MKTRLLLLALAFLAGCKFAGPLTEKPTRDIEPALLGSWFSLVDGTPLGVFKLSDQEYLVVDNGEPYVATHSDHAGASFVSCRQIANDPDRHGKYAYVAYKLEGDQLTLFPLNGSLSLTENSTPTEIRAALEEAARTGSALDTNPDHFARYKRKP